MKKTVYSSLVLVALMGAPHLVFAETETDHPTLSKSSRNNNADEVKILQQWLIDLKDKDGNPYYSGTVSGTFDDATLKAVKKFQKEKGVVSRGRYWGTVGDKTWAMLENNHKTFASAPAKTKIEVIVPDVVSVPEVVKAPTVTPVAVSMDELKKHDLGLSFVGDSIQMTGSLHEECAKRLRFTDLKEFAAESSEESAPASSDELAKRAKRLGLRITFDGDDKMKTLSDCEESLKDKPGKVELAGRSSLYKTFISRGKLILAGILGESNEFLPLDPRVTSTTFKKLESQINDKPCSTCESNPGLAKKRLNELSGLDFPWLGSIQKGLVEKSISQQKDAAKGAKSLSDLVRIRKDLEDLAKSVNNLEIDSSEREALLESIASQLDDLIKRSETMAVADQKACEKKSTAHSYYKTSACESESAHADFISGTYQSISKLPGLPEASKDDARQASEDFASGGSERVKFIASIDPVNPEVRDALDRGSEDLRYLAQNVQRECSFMMSQENFMRCNQARQDYSRTQSELQELGQRYSSMQYANQMATSGISGYPANGMSQFGYGNNMSQFGYGNNLYPFGYGSNLNVGYGNNMNVGYGNNQNLFSYGSPNLTPAGFQAPASYPNASLMGSPNQFRMNNSANLNSGGQSGGQNGFKPNSSIAIPLNGGIGSTGPSFYPQG